MDSSSVEIPTLNTTMTETELLGIKLREEINHLEKWMKSQLNCDRKSNTAIVNTIKGLIETRQSLLLTLDSFPEDAEAIIEADSDEILEELES